MVPYQKNKKGKYINKDGKWCRTIKKHAMMNGVSYIMDEEEVIGSEDDSSGPATSEDEFQVDNGIMSQFHKRIISKLNARGK